MLVMLIVCVSSAGTTIVHFRPKWLESRAAHNDNCNDNENCNDNDNDSDVIVMLIVCKCWHNHRPLPPQVAGEQGRAGADHRRADVEEGGHLEGA